MHGQSAAASHIADLKYGAVKQPLSQSAIAVNSATNGTHKNVWRHYALAMKTNASKTGVVESVRSIFISVIELSCSAGLLSSYKDIGVTASRFTINHTVRRPARS
jgi:hypothetical protein